MIIKRWPSYKNVVDILKQTSLEDFFKIAYFLFRKTSFCILTNLIKRLNSVLTLRKTRTSDKRRGQTHLSFPLHWRRNKVEVDNNQLMSSDTSSSRSCPFVIITLRSLDWTATRPLANYSSSGFMCERRRKRRDLPVLMDLLVASCSFTVSL